MNFIMFSGFTDALLSRGPAGVTDYAKGLGFSGGELFASTEHPTCDPVPDAKTARELGGIFKKQDFPIACFSVYTTLWNRPENEAFLMKKAEMASEMECPFLHHTLFPTYHPAPDDPDYAEARERILESAARIANHAARYGVTCLYEDQGAYFNSVAGYGGLWNELERECKNVGICADLGNILFVGETPEVFLRAFATRVRHVHLKDYQRVAAPACPGEGFAPATPGTWLRDCDIGTGVVDFAACLSLLRDAGYTGAYALEILSHRFDSAAQEAMTYVRNIL